MGQWEEAKETEFTTDISVSLLSCDDVMGARLKELKKRNEKQSILAPVFQRSHSTIPWINHFLSDYQGILSYNPPNNFFGLSLDKTDHVIQNRPIVARRTMSAV